MNQIGLKSISEIAAGKKTAAILIDTMSYSTPVGGIVPFLIEELEEADIAKENMIIILATVN